MLDDYEVGYKKPPKKHQFPKGKSGNPKGRPPKKTMYELLNMVLDEEVTITSNGQKIKMTKKEVTMQQLVNDCMKGKNPSIKNLILLINSFSQHGGI